MRKCKDHRGSAMGLAIDLANGWLEGSLDRRPLRRGPMTAMDRTAAKMTVAREGSFVVVKLIDDIQEKLVRRHFYRSSGEAVFFSDSHGNPVDAAGRRLFYRDGALWYVGPRHQSEMFKRSLFYILLVPLLVPVALLINKSQRDITFSVIFFVGIISILLFMLYRSRREQASDMSAGRIFRRIPYAEFRRNFFWVQFFHKIDVIWPFFWVNFRVHFFVDGIGTFARPRQISVRGRIFGNGGFFPCFPLLAGCQEGVGTISCQPWPCR
jgi:hypothetical protein